MKILYLTNIPSPYRVDFFNELAKSCELTVLYERRHATNRDPSWLETGNLRFQARFLPGLKVGMEAGLNPSVLRFLNRNKYDIIVVGGYSTPTGILAVLYMNFCRVPYLINVDGGIIKNDRPYKTRLKRWLLSHASAYLSSGGQSDAYLYNYGVKSPIYRYPLTSIAQADVFPAPSGLEEKKSIRDSLKIHEANVVFSAGQFIHRKGFDLLLRAVADVAGDVGVYIAGGEPVPEYLNLIKELGLKNIHFVGFINKHELRRYCRAADIFVLPTREDIWGLVVNEAMSCGLPVITTKSCAAGCELIDDGRNGRLVPTESVEALADSISELLDFPERKDRMGAEALRRISSCTIEAMARRHLDIFREINSENQRPKKGEGW